MKRILAILLALRIPNLALMYLTLALPYWCVLRPALLQAGTIPALDERLFHLIAATSLLAALSGYIINDYYDIRMDMINKPRRVVVGRILPPAVVLAVYLICVGGVFALSVYLAQAISQPYIYWPLWIFPGVTLMLFLYAWRLKCTPLTGNLLISVLCAIVPITLLFPEERAIWLAYYYAPTKIHQAVGLVWLYAVFAFASNFLREQIKDLEDFEGDSACNCLTLPVMRGPAYARKPAILTALALSGLTFLLVYFWFHTHAPFWQIAAGLFALFGASVAVVFRLMWAKQKAHFTQASALVKLVMFAGVFLLLRY